MGNHLSPEGLPPIPRCRVDKVLQLRDRIFSAVKPFLGTARSGPDFVPVVNAIANVFRERNLSVSSLSVEDSVKYLSGSLLRQKDVFLLAWRLAANVETLKQRRPVLPWSLQREKEWAVVQVIRSEFAINRDRSNKLQYGSSVKLVFLTGSAAGCTVEQFWKKKKLMLVASRGGAKLNLRREQDSLELREVNEFYGFRFWVLLDPDRSRNNQPGFFHIRITPSLVVSNASLLKKRKRKNFRCPHSYKHSCSVCPIGKEQCEVATHQRNHQQGQCATCHKRVWLEVVADKVSINCRRCVPYVILNLKPPKPKEGQ